MFSTVGRRLVHDHHVGQRETEKPIVADEQPLEDARHVSALFAVQVSYGGHAASGVEVYLVRVVGVEGDEGCEVFPLHDQAAPVFVLPGQEVAVQATGLVL